MQQGLPIRSVGVVRGAMIDAVERFETPKEKCQQPPVAGAAIAPHRRDHDNEITAADIAARTA